REHIFPLIRAQQSSLAQDRSLHAVAHTLSASPDSLRKEFADWLSKQTEEVINNDATQPLSERRIIGSDMRLLGILHLIQGSHPDIYKTTIQSFKDLFGEDGFVQFYANQEQYIPEYAFIAEHEYGTDIHHLQK